MIGPRAKLALLAALFALPIAASFLTYHFAPPEPTANYGELLLPPANITSQSFSDSEGAHFAFALLAGKWVLVVSDSGECAAACVEKLTTLRQVRLALGRNAPRVERVLVVDDLRRPDVAALKDFAGTAIVVTPPGLQLPPGAANDRAHIYLVDPRGNVMMRWPAGADRKRMLGDLQRLLKASQIG
jgi:cytochrome oxidase Cu insertion factor (SCO1/SenC/PrrC family)